MKDRRAINNDNVNKPPQMNGTTSNQMVDQQQEPTHSNTHETMAQPPSSRYELRSTPSRKRSNLSRVSTAANTTDDTNNQANDTNDRMSSSMKRQRRKVANSSISTTLTSTVIDSVENEMENEPIEMKRMEDVMNDGSAIQLTTVAAHSTVRHILHLDQTALRLCASLLEQQEIIAFGRSCHSTYSTLNHPLTWTHTYPMEIGLDPLPLLFNGIHPFLQHLPGTWRILAEETNIAGRLTQLVSQLEQPPPRYRLVGLTIYPDNNNHMNEATSQLVIQLLQNPNLVHHLSTIFFMGSCEQVVHGGTWRRYFLPNHLFEAILQLQHLNRLYVVLRELTSEFVNQFVQVQAPLSELKINLTVPPKREAIIALMNAPLCQGLVKLALPTINFKLDGISDSLIRLPHLKSLHLISCFNYVQLIPTLSKILALRHLYITHLIQDDHEPQLIQFIQELDVSMPHLDTITICFLSQQSLGPDTPCSSHDTHSLRELQQYVEQRHGPSHAPRSPAAPTRLFVRLRKTPVFGCM